MSVKPEGGALRLEAWRMGGIFAGRLCLSFCGSVDREGGEGGFRLREGLWLWSFIQSLFVVSKVNIRSFSLGGSRTLCLDAVRPHAKGI